MNDITAAEAMSILRVQGQAPATEQDALEIIQREGWTRLPPEEAAPLLQAEDERRKQQEEQHEEYAAFIRRSAERAQADRELLRRAIANLASLNLASLNLVSEWKLGFIRQHRHPRMAAAERFHSRTDRLTGMGDINGSESHLGRGADRPLPRSCIDAPYQWGQAARLLRRLSLSASCASRMAPRRCRLRPTTAKAT